jgi:hypothetical protein
MCRRLWWVGFPWSLSIAEGLPPVRDCGAWFIRYFFLSKKFNLRRFALHPTILSFSEKRKKAKKSHR